MVINKNTPKTTLNQCFSLDIINKCMIQHKAFKYRIYPTQAQAAQLAQFFGAKRWIYNHFLAEQKRRFACKLKHLSNFDMNKVITDLKQQDETNWLRGIDDWCLKHTTEDLSNAYQQFFNSIKGKRHGKKMQPPRFKKKSNQQSYRTRGVIHVSESGIKLPKIKTHININLHRPVQGKIVSATVTKTPSGKYFVSVLCELDIELKPSMGREVGIDLGLTSLAILSDGIKFAHPEQYIAKAKQLLKQQQRILSRKTRGSKNYQRTRVRLAKKHEQIANFKRNYYHNISHFLVTNYDAIYMEDLNVLGMLGNRHLSRKIHESNWSMLSSLIEYKCSWYGKTYYRINRWVPSTKTCSHCNHKMHSVPLNVRNWVCPACHTSHDRDINAAQNIKNTGQRDLYNQIISDAIAEMDGSDAIPRALQKMTDKIQRSDATWSVSHGSGQAADALASR